MGDQMMQQPQSGSGGCFGFAACGAGVQVERLFRMSGGSDDAVGDGEFDSDSMREASGVYVWCRSASWSEKQVATRLRRCPCICGEGLRRSPVVWLSYGGGVCGW